MSRRNYHEPTSRLTAVRLPVTEARLRELAENPNIQSAAIAKMFGYGRAGFFTYIVARPDLWAVYERARTKAGFVVNGHRPTEWKRPHAKLTIDETIIVNAIRDGQRRFNDLRATAIAAGVDARRFASILYNLEHETHVVWSQSDDGPTQFFLRGAEEDETEVRAVRGQKSVPGAVATGLTRKRKAA